MALSVGLLWGCILAERITLHKAYAEKARVLRNLELLQHRREMPVSTPIPVPGRMQSSAG